MNRTVVAVALAWALIAGCATSFQGSSRVRGGPQGCVDRCRRDRLVMEAFVHVGEYSTACVCTIPERRGASASAAVAAAPAVVGVALQMRRAEEGR